MRKRIFALALGVWMLLAQALPGYAAQSRAANFLKTYTLTGDGPADLIAVAQAQLYRSGESLGYSEQWCADFISDCARLAGQSRAVPFHNNVYGLRDQILQAGGTISTTDPQPGDICFLDWEMDGNWDHVELVYLVSGGGIYTIGGNTGQGEDYAARRVGKHTPVPKSQIAMILRPAYRTDTQPQIPAQEEEIPVTEWYSTTQPVQAESAAARFPSACWNGIAVHLLY